MKKPTYDIHEVIASMPAGLDRAVLRVLSFHVGKDHAIKKPDLQRRLADVGFRVHERIIRAQIELLQEDHLICSSSSSSEGGYYLASNWDEVTEFDQREITPRIKKLSHKRSSLLHQAEKRFGPPPEAHQITMF